MQIFLLLDQCNNHQKLFGLIFVAHLQKDLCHKGDQSVYNLEGLTWLYTMIRHNLRDYQKHVVQCFSVLSEEPMDFLCFERHSS